ncbi:DNA-binding response regulator [Pseudonocardia sulfidoxydans NBRC 16205]|uniref:DNA-binding response regulator n=1 Tax=Pseudonocardia sulfidoxydans NBRC 16205 TaxID=1223511 RepID=A0A511DLE4_9PSEU|nr:response regulator transcription factor [Pseudonocardia sulfidoxydans]GEL25629.1 DNA-binding response regulator [Pseudonocardia sulfidoxydans NBRC 16205]
MARPHDPTSANDVVLCDDHPIFADALCIVLTARGVTVRAVVNTAGDVLPAVRTHRPRVCVVDRHLGPDDGLDLIAGIVAAGTGTRVLVLSGDRDPATARRAIDAGAAGYVCKTAGVAALVDAVRAVLAGECVVDVPAATAAPRSRADAEAHRLAAHLTPRERECLALIVDGLGTGAITERLGVSAATVRTYVQGVLTKLGVHSRIEAASFAVRHDLLRHAD